MAGKSGGFRRLFVKAENQVCMKRGILMKNFYDILQYLKTYDVFIHLGKRLWDIEMAALEVDNLYKADVISKEDYKKMKVILAKEHDQEAKLTGDYSGPDFLAASSVQ